ncbi:hypothetical protein CEP53_007690 [Fusarium sp. AF-6]|nr:hypothetical protein CEP53_007690 [Fusarium sp. AF-6]
MFKVITARLHPPKPSPLRLDGLTVLLVGASTGIGLEAAKKLATKGPAKLIVTARDASKASKTKTLIEEHLSATSTPQSSIPTIIPLVVELTSPKSIYAFAHDLAQATDHLDHAILSAGILLGSYSQVSKTGYETSLQVNAISPMLMSLLIMPLLLASPRVHNESVTDRPHLTIVSSGGAWLVKKSGLSPYVDFDHPLCELSKKENFPPGMMGGQWHYSRTKLMCEYGKRHLAMLPSLNDAKGQPKVLVASVCPGAVNSELSRHSANSGVLGAMARVVNGTVARTPEQGANIYISSLNLGVEGRGEMWTDDAISKDARPFIASHELKRLGDNVWGEVKEFAAKVDEMHGSGVVKRLLT